MIKQIFFKNTKDFSKELISITLSKNVNVIIGPKGGGKSTLFDLIVGLKNNYISDNVIKALKSYNLAFEKAIKYSNEEILFSQLSKKSKKEKDLDYKNRNDVIYQDDQIKKELTSIKEIEDKKIEYIKKQVDSSEAVVKFIMDIKNFYSFMNTINDYFKNDIVDINWTNTFKMNEMLKNDKLNLITKIDYKSNILKKDIEDELNEYKKILDIIEESKLKLNKAKTIDKTKIINDLEYEEQFNQYVDQIIHENKKIISLINQRTLLLKKIGKMTDIFLQSYKKVLDKIKNENYSTGGLKSYEVSAKNHFKNLAKDIYKTINLFEELNSKKIILNIENDLNQKDALTFKIPENIEINDEAKTEILKVVFHSPGSSRDDVTKWLKSLTEKGIKEFREDLIKSCISKQIKDNIIVLVDFGDQKKDYETLSLGQKSIYGLKYKFNKSINQNIYLDQPEDNLDNNTIAIEILPMLKEKKEQQVVIVTHNANIGILSNPGKVIIADLNNQEEPYKIADINEIINENSAHYLEGGKEFLNIRYKKIIENKEI